MLCLLPFTVYKKSKQNFCHSVSGVSRVSESKIFKPKGVQMERDADFQPCAICMNLTAGKFEFNRRKQPVNQLYRR